MADSSQPRAFPANARVVQFADPPRDRDARVCVAFPAWAHRVTAPVMPRRRLDLFERVVLGLCQAGIREPASIAERIRLHPRLCSHIMDQAVDQGLLDRDGELTHEGRRALRTGTLAEEVTWSVCHVFQAPGSGELWPRTAEQLTNAHVIGRDAATVRLQFGTRGRPDTAEALVLRPPGDEEAAGPLRPGAAQIIEVARLDRVARRVHQVREFERREKLASAALPDEMSEPAGDPRLAPDGTEGPELSRVAFVDEPEPVLVVGFAEAAPGGALRCHDPFGAGTNAMFQELMEASARADAELADRIRRVTTRETEQVAHRYREAKRDARAGIEAALVAEFGAGIRDDPGVLDLISEIDLDTMEGEGPGALERVAQNSYRLYEILFRKLVDAYPPPTERLTGARRTAEYNRAVIEESAHRIGLRSVPALFHTDLVGAAARLNRPDANLYVKDAAPLCLLAAHDNADHPLRRLAARRPDLLSALATLGGLRNRAAHAGRDPSTRHDAPWCRELAALAVRELIPLR
ncbi:hypothetical protein ABZ801_11230 [Actinomadura sp. NPDC047616]|uniref:hypothetical protein n=1 Tax=Actinomadura sp. NPDC047616 TaxID=3155914 RepID=UPI0033F7684B